jgi:hypothetical protein
VYADPKAVRLIVPAACAGLAIPTKYENSRTKAASARSQRQLATDDWVGILFSLLTDSTLSRTIQGMPNILPEQTNDNKPEQFSVRRTHAPAATDVLPAIYRFERWFVPD